VAYARVTTPPGRQDAPVAPEKVFHTFIPHAVFYRAVNEKNWNSVFYAMNTHARNMTARIWPTRLSLTKTNSAT
jgi:hypothetical protein